LPQTSPAVPVEKARITKDLQVSPQNVWTITDLELRPGERATFRATGTGRCAGQDTDFGPGGIPRGFRDLLRILPMSQAGRGALIGRIGDADVAQPFVIGPSTEIVAPAGGTLAIGMNGTHTGYRRELQRVFGIDRGTRRLPV
jgi:hypothetical protein